jgi:uncharacterized lipoprotein YmbA
MKFFEHLRRARVAIATTAAISTLFSCTHASGPAKGLYALDAGQPAEMRAATRALHASMPAAGIPAEQIVEVRRVSIAEPFDGPALIYRTPGGTYVKDYYNEWVAPPEELLSTQLVNWLGASGPFASAVGARSAVPHRFALEVSVTNLYGDFQDHAKPAVVLGARAYLIDEASNGRTVVCQGQYDVTVPLPKASAQEMVAGSGRAYRQLLEALSKDLAAHRPAAVAVNER